MSVERIEITASPDVLAAWQEHFASADENADGLTVSELAKMAGISAARMRARIKEGVEAGKFERVGTGIRHDAIGRANRMPVYRVKETKKRKA